MNPGMALYSAHQIQLSSSPNQITYQEQGSCYSPGPHRSPVGTSKPFTMHPETPEVWNAPITPTSSSFPYNPSRGVHRPSLGLDQEVAHVLIHGKAGVTGSATVQALVHDEEAVLALVQEEVGVAGMEEA